MFNDRERCLRAVLAKDPRFDGQFVTAVVTTRIYCRPSCPVVAPKPENMRFLPTAASAQAAGFRACKRCRPDAAPGSPEWDARSDLVARAVRLIADGAVDRGGVDGLARTLGYGRRHLLRQMHAVLGTGPLALARSQRAQTARVLLETTTMPMGDVAFAAGFGSVRQFNDTVREVFALTPTDLRRTLRSAVPDAAPGTIRIQLPFRSPLVPDSLLGHLAATAVPGVEEWRQGAYRRTLRLPSGTGIVELRPLADHVECRLSLSDLRDVAVAVSRCRRLLDLDTDPSAVAEALAADPHLRPLVEQAPGRRVPRTVDEAELAVRAVLGQQVSTRAARTHAHRLVLAVGEPIADTDGGLTHLFPTAEAVAGVDPAELRLPSRRRETLLSLVGALASGALELGVGVDRAEATAALDALPGIGPWTSGTIAMRALGDPDVFLAGDLGVRAGASAVGLPGAVGPLDRHARRWRPWRSYAVQYLWAATDHAVNRLPEPEQEAVA